MEGGRRQGREERGCFKRGRLSKPFLAIAKQQLGGEWGGENMEGKREQPTAGIDYYSDTLGEVP